MAIQGTCEPKFQAVRQEFERNFQERGEVGASVCVTVQGQTVVDLWGGQANAEADTPWTEDTVSIVFSATKGATAICAHMLASRGQLNLDAPVAKYWPEFAQSGKQNIPVKMLLNHQAGLPAVREPLPQGAYADWDLMVNALAKQEPFWEPGTRNGYHALTFGWLVGEVGDEGSQCGPGNIAAHVSLVQPLPGRVGSGDGQLEAHHRNRRRDGRSLADFRIRPWRLAGAFSR
jgi:CubicO group peptidase (beta-lactamase class C family)